MSYAVQIVIGRPVGPENDTALPTVRLPTLYDTIREAEIAGAAYLKDQREKHPDAAEDSAFWRVVDDNDNPVGSAGEPV